MREVTQKQIEFFLGCDFNPNDNLEKSVWLN
jgi:hypothetical protein